MSNERKEKSLFTRLKGNNMKIKTKIILTPIVIFAMIFLVVGIVSNISLQKSQNKELKENLHFRAKNITFEIEKVAKTALSEAAIFAGLPVVKKAYEEFYKTGNIKVGTKILIDNISPIIKELEKTTGEKKKIHFHLPPARSFIRMWNHKGGDDLTSFRDTILTISQTKKPIMGIEPGRAGLVIRGLAPIFDNNGKYLGDVESIHIMKNIYESTNNFEKEDLAIYMDKSLLSITTKFETSNVKKNAMSFNEFIFINKSKNFNQDLTEEFFEKGKKESTIFQKGDFAYISFPIKSFNKAVVAVMIYQYNLKESKDSINNMKLMIAIPALILFAIGIMILFVIALSISKPISKLSIIAKRAANGDLTTLPEPTNKNDEVGSLIRAFTDMMINLKEQTRKIKEGTSIIASTTAELAITASELSANSSESATSISEITSTIQEVRQTSSSSSDKAKEVAAEANNATQIANRGTEASESAATGMLQIKSEMESIANSIINLSEQTQSIGEIIGVVNNLSEQSNLLSVNASIEAAKAGEYGKGFAVVAQEVKTLADQSKASTTQVNTILNAIQKAARAAVQSTERGNNVVENGVSLTTQTGESISALVNSIEDSANNANQIAISSNEQLIGIDQLATAMSDVKEAASQNLTGANQLKIAIEDLNNIGKDLNNLANKFKV